MKIQIDTTNKTITVNEEVNLLEFIEYLKNIPNWELYTIKGIIEWVPYYIPQQPIIVPLGDRQIIPYTPITSPYNEPFIYYQTSSKL